VTEQAEKMFSKLLKDFKYDFDKSMNKQKGAKKAEAYLTCAINIILENEIENLVPLKGIHVIDPVEKSLWVRREELKKLGTDKYIKALIKNKKIGKAKYNRKDVYSPADVQKYKLHCNYNPRTLTTLTHDGRPVGTLARRVDGAYPSTINPIAIWEIKEYYYTTSFGSRVADGIYETLLDGIELEQVKKISERHEVKHYLFVDAYDTWWKDGKSYLCRLVDSIHMGYVDEVLFGNEILDRLPELVTDWVREKQKRDDVMGDKDEAASKALVTE